VGILVRLGHNIKIHEAVPGLEQLAENRSWCAFSDALSFKGSGMNQAE
jgi:hypothetical protein